MEDLHKMLDTRCLNWHEKVQAVNSCLDHAPTNLVGYDFQKDLRVYLGCMGRPSRLSRVIGRSMYFVSVVTKLT